MALRVLAPICTSWGDINSAFSGLPAQATDYIKSQTTAATYYDGFGFYPAFNVNVRNMYLLRLIEGGTMVYEGIPADPSDNPITLAPLSNAIWIELSWLPLSATMTSPFILLFLICFMILRIFLIFAFFFYETSYMC